MWHQFQTALKTSFTPTFFLIIFFNFVFMFLHESSFVFFLLITSKYLTLKTFFGRSEFFFSSKFPRNFPVWGQTFRSACPPASPARLIARLWNGEIKRNYRLNVVKFSTKHLLTFQFFLKLAFMFVKLTINNNLIWFEWQFTLIFGETRIKRPHAPVNDFKVVSWLSTLKRRKFSLTNSAECCTASPWRSRPCLCARAAVSWEWSRSHCCCCCD